MQRFSLFLLATSMLLALGGCQEEAKPFQGKYNDSSVRYFLLFQNGEVTITTPEGEMTKTFEIEDGKIEVLYWDALGKDTMLHFVENELKTRLHCKECAKYQLPSYWNLDAR